MKLNVVKSIPFGAIVEPTNSGDDVSSLKIPELRALLEREHLIVLRGFKTFESKDEFADYCGHWGEISIWPFGKVLELIEQENPDDHIFDHNYVPLHWDGMYRPQVPELQIFHCVSSPGVDNGGRTTFSNTALAFERASPKDRNLWAQATGVYQRKMEFYHSKTEAPVVTEHPVRGYPVIRYCEPPKRGDASFVNHSDYAFHGVAEGGGDELERSLRRALYSPDNFYAHEWHKGDVVISDNYTLLHGREAFTSGAPRHLRRVHVLGKPPLENPHLVFHV
jgi:alpha-ketoglutarate-dependent taurine dioxygenase